MSEGAPPASGEDAREAAVQRALSDAQLALGRGDLDELRTLLQAVPDLPRARFVGAGPPRDGYFHRATLLHHVSGNPEVKPVPAAAVAFADLLLDSGAEVDAKTEPGPSQPDDPGWTTLGLVATSAVARTAGQQAELIDRLVERGADPGVDRSTPLAGALFYGEQDAAERLVEHGAPVDLRLAAGLGRLDLLEGFLAPDGTLGDGAAACSLYPTPLTAPPPADRRVPELGLVLAAMRGQSATCAWLLDRGVDVAAQPHWHGNSTALHWAAWHGHEETCDLLLERGAPRDPRDAVHRATPAEWAAAAGRLALAQRLA